MGCFDTVNARCPKCGEVVKFQSKAGKCILATYSNTSVPMEIAADLNGDIEECPKCETTIKLIIPSTQPRRLAMEIVIGEDDGRD